MPRTTAASRGRSRSSDLGLMRGIVDEPCPNRSRLLLLYVHLCLLLPVATMRFSLVQLMALTLWMSTAAVAAEPRVTAPHSGTVVMVDGKLSPDEWRGATNVKVPGVANLYFKQAAGFVYLAVE